MRQGASVLSFGIQRRCFRALIVGWPLTSSSCHRGAPHTTLPTQIYARTWWQPTIRALSDPLIGAKKIVGTHTPPPSRSCVCVFFFSFSFFGASTRSRVRTALWLACVGSWGALLLEMRGEWATYRLHMYLSVRARILARFRFAPLCLLVAESVPPPPLSLSVYLMHSFPPFFLLSNACTLPCPFFLFSTEPSYETRTNTKFDVELDPELPISAVKAKLAETQGQAVETMVLVHKVRGEWRDERLRRRSRRTQ